MEEDPDRACLPVQIGLEGDPEKVSGGILVLVEETEKVLGGIFPEPGMGGLHLDKPPKFEG